jgi:signal peptidase II
MGSGAGLSRTWTGAWPWYALAALVVALDQFSKGLATAALDYGVPRAVLPWFNLTLQHNTGAAFSFLSGAAGWQRYFFSAVALVMSVVLVVWLWRLPRNNRVLALGLGLVLGGALGNLWDRLALGYVVDFISVHWQDRYFFPAFNIADSAITVGAGCLLLDAFVYRDGHGSGEKEEAQS